MTLSKAEPRGVEARREGVGENSAAAAEEDSAATPYKGSRCCVGFFQCQVCGHEWSSVYSWANTGQLCKPCSSKRRQTWVLPFRQIPKSRKYEFFCIDCDRYIAESFRNRDAHQGVACGACKGVVFPDWEFPCDDCNVVHLYSFSKTDAMRGIDCDCGAYLFPKHMKSLNRKHESQFCQKCQELGVNCCNFKARQSIVEKEDAAAGSVRKDASKKKSSPTAKRSPPIKKSDRPKKARQQRASVSSVDADASGPETKTAAPKKSGQRRRKPQVSVSSVEGDGDVVVEKTSARARKPKAPVERDEGEEAAPKKSTRSKKPKVSVSIEEGEAVEKKVAGGRKPGQRRKPRVSFSSVDGEEDAIEKPPARRRPSPKQKQRVSEVSEDGEPSADEKTTTKRPPRRRPSAPKPRKQRGVGEADEGEEIVAETANRVASARGGRGRGAAVRGVGRGGGTNRPPRAHVYGENDVLRHARTPKNSVATDPGIREPMPEAVAGGDKKSAASRPRQQRRPKPDRVGRTNPASTEKVDEASSEVDALADQVAESVILSAQRAVIVEVEDVDIKAPRQQKDENDNSIIVEKMEEMKIEAAAEKEAIVSNETAALSSSSSPSKSKAAAAAPTVELKGGHPPAIKVGGRRRVSSGRKSESEGKKVDVESAQKVDLESAQPEIGAAEKGEAREEAEVQVDPENSQVQVVAKAKSVNHSEMTSVPEKPSPTKDINRMPKVHAHHPTHKHPIQQPKKC